jgi:hypothetical protein
LFWMDLTSQITKNRQNGNETNIEMKNNWESFRCSSRAGLCDLFVSCPHVKYLLPTFALEIVNAVPHWKAKLDSKLVISYLYMYT